MVNGGAVLGEGVNRGAVLGGLDNCYCTEPLCVIIGIIGMFDQSRMYYMEL